MLGKLIQGIHDTFAEARKLRAAIDRFQVLPDQ